MGRRSLAALLTILATVAACAPPPAPPPSDATDGPCRDGLPRRTSPTDYPVAVIHVADEDLAPVLGEVEWLGGDEPVATSAARPVHLERFTVLQVQGVAELSLRMTDGVRLVEWRVTAIPDDAFRAGDIEDGVEWSSGDEATDVVCVPVEDGSWAIRADLTFADNGGRGTYYWRLNVSESPSG